MKSKFNKLIEKYSSELKMGINVEKEHKGTLSKIKKSIKNNRLTLKNQKVYTSIAKDHLKELPDYYTRLKKVEQPAEAIAPYDIANLIEEKKKAKKKKKKKSKRVRTLTPYKGGYRGGGWGYWGGAGWYNDGGDGGGDSGGDGGDGGGGD